MLGRDDALMTTHEIAAVAAKKLTKGSPSEVDRYFRQPLNETTKALMLALMGCRIAIQTGSYVFLVQELVASHMMVLAKVENNREQLEGCYPSEPILAEASSAVTARNGWTKPLQTLIASLRHGIVQNGFRGEFVTKVLLCMTMEDCLRRSAHDDSEDYFPYSRPVSVNDFLSALLCVPGIEDADDNDGTQRRHKRH
jgi:hypothetical protein